MKLRILFFLAMLFSVHTYADPFHTSGFRSDAPPIVDPFEGLIEPNLLIKNKEVNIPDFGNKRIAIILTSNTNKHLQWSESNMVGKAGADLFFGTLVGGKALMDKHNAEIKKSYDPQTIINGVLKPLVANAKELKIVNDLAEFRESKFDLAAVVDINFINFFEDGIFNTKYETGTFITVFFISPSLSMGPVIKAGQRKPIPRNAFMQNVIKVRAEVFDEYYAEAIKVIGIQKIQALVSPDRSARLTEVEDLRKKGLISESEATEKRIKILDGI